MKATSEVDYPAYGVTGPAQPANGKDGSPGDRKLAQSAQMYHYQHQKQQMIASERYIYTVTFFDFILLSSSAPNLNRLGSYLAQFA